MTSHKIVLLSGDGIGPEITSVTRKILEVLSEKHSLQLHFEDKPFGGQAIELTNNPLPESTLEVFSIVGCC